MTESDDGGDDAGPHSPVFLYVSDGWLSDGIRQDAVVLVRTSDNMFRYATDGETELFYRMHGSNAQ